MNRLLPPEPGRARRLAYGDMIRRRNMGRTRALAFVVGYNTNPTYEELVRLPVVRQGLTMREVCRVSKVSISADSCFCAICQETLRVGKDIARLLFCNHAFHLACIDNWFREGSTCPLCKMSMRD
jgi:hypothetical protein